MDSYEIFANVYEVELKLKQLPNVLTVMSTSRLAFAETDTKTLDRKRRLFNPLRKLYSTKRWKVLRLDIFLRDIFTCQMDGCGLIEGNTSWLVCDHIKKPEGNERLFWDEDNLQTLCKSCHDTIKQSQEKS